MKLGLIVGEICESHKRLIWEKTNLVWIDPTRDMSPYQINEFRNRMIDMSFNNESEDETLFVWTNNQEIIDNIHSSIIWRVDDNKLFCEVKEPYCSETGRYEFAARNWDIYPVKLSEIPEFPPEK